MTASVSAAELFVPELVLGVDAIDGADHSRLGEYLAAVIRARGFPLHIAVAWNALHFGFDTDANSYSADLLGSFMPTIGLGGVRNEALPVGALAWVHVGGRESDAWAEVVGKDGRAAGAAEWSVDPAIAGAPAETEVVDGFSRAVISEALVVDFGAFGFVENLPARLDRLRRKGRFDPHGLILTDAVYHPAEAANDEDLWFYARWLVERQPGLLRAGPLGAAVGRDADRETLAAAVMASFASVSDIVGGAEGLRRWGDYALAREWVDDVDMDAHLPLGAADLEHVLAGLRRDGRDGPTAATLLARLEPLSHFGPQPDRPDREVRDPLAGVGYLRHVARASRWLADRVDEAGRVFEVNGQLVTVRVDDLFPNGGLWRAQPIVLGHPLLEVPADVPLEIGRLGWARLAEYLELPLTALESRIAAAETAAAEATAVKASGAERQDHDGGDTPEDDDEQAAFDRLDATLVSATLTVRARDLDHDLATLPATLSWLEGDVTVMLTHAGDLDDDQAIQAAKVAADRLSGVRWPMDFFPGIRLTVSVFRAGTTLFATTLPLVPPAVIDGVEYPFAFDPSIVRPDRVASPADENDDGPGDRGAVNVVAVILAGLARRGRPASDGTRRATARELAVICFGTGHPRWATTVIEQTLEPEVEAGRLDLIGSEYAWAGRRGTRPTRPSRPAGWEPPRLLDRAAVALHHVPGFLRQLPPGWVASEVKRASYREAREAGQILFGPEILPHGYTWVRAHDRGAAAVAWDGALSGIISTIDGLSPDADDLATMRSAWNLTGGG